MIVVGDGLQAEVSQAGMDREPAKSGWGVRPARGAVWSLAISRIRVLDTRGYPGVSGLLELTPSQRNQDRRPVSSNAVT